MTTDEFRNKADEEILNLFVLATEGYAVDYFRMELDRAYRHKQVAYILREELRRRLYNAKQPRTSS